MFFECLALLPNRDFREIPLLQAKSEEKGKEKLLYFRKADTAMA